MRIVDAREPRPGDMLTRFDLSSGGETIMLLSAILLTPGKIGPDEVKLSLNLE
jgi:hypothetical protein